MKFLLTSSGISNASIHKALIDLLGKPVAESTALCIPTAAYGCPGSGPGIAWRLISGKAQSPLCELGWKSLGVLELTALPTMEEQDWASTVRNVDALLVGGGDVLYLRHWMRKSGLGDLMPSLRPEALYVGLSAGSMVVASHIGEVYVDHRPPSDSDIRSEDIMLTTAQGRQSKVTFALAPGMGLVDFTLFPHLDRETMPDTAMANVEKWAARVPVPMYGIDDQTAIKVTGGAVEVISEGHWRLFTPSAKAPSGTNVQSAAIDKRLRTLE